MKRAAFVLILMGTLAPAPRAEAAATATVRRFLVAAGANRGTTDRVALRYAVSDAERVARVLTTMGGVDPADAVVLKEPNAQRLREALESLAARIPAADPGGGRTEVLVYYSGHADENGLLLNNERLAYQSLRDALGRLPADLSIAILDACSSGAITRLKGGKWQQPFLVDASSDMRGYAFLTSSSESEAAQESDRLRGSFFTHYLLSGLRGAADATGDGRVTLNEAYQFAFGETLARTTRTQGGSQHPAYDMRLAGTGDVVMTELRRTSAGLTLGEGVGGRFFVRDANRHLVAELFKPEGRVVDLGLEPGEYVIDLETIPELLTASISLTSGERRLVGPELFRSTNRDATVRRGGPPGPGLPAGPAAVAPRGPFRSRLLLDFGIFRTRGDKAATVVTSGDNTWVSGFTGGLTYEYAVDSRFAVGFSTGGHVIEASHEDLGSKNRDSALVVVPLLFRARYHFLTDNGQSQVRPYVNAGVGPYMGVISETNDAGVNESSRTLTVFGGRLGGGVDIAPTRYFSLGLDVSYDWISRFPEALRGRRDLSGLSVAVNFGFAFGPRAPYPPR